jgi:predicted kinase
MPTLYLMLGYPGAGKTTTARIISELTGAEHIWADRERNKMFGRPTHGQDESLALYSRLNAETDRLLSAGRSVIFDTSFNYYKDRDHLRSIAAKHGAELVILWVQTPKEIAKARALSHDHAINNRYPETMSPEQFATLTGKLEEPRPHEQVIVLDGSLLSADYISEKLSAHTAA